MSAPLLERPRALSVALDARPARSATGSPTEQLRAGSLRALVAFAAYYASRERGCAPTDARHAVDVDFVDIFWRTLQAFSSGAAVGLAFVSLARSSEVEGAPLVVASACDALSAGLDARGKPYLGYLPFAQVISLLAASRAVAQITAASARRESDPSVARSLTDALTRLEDRIADAEVFLDVAVELGGVARGGTAALGAAAATFIVSGRAAPPRVSSLDYDPVCAVDVSSSGVGGGFAWHEVPVRTFAEAWAVADFDAFASIPVGELLSAGWDGPRYKHSADGVHAFVDRFNAVAVWVAAEILAPQSPRDRADRVSRFIDIADELRALNDFAGVAEIVFALRREEVKRLSATWAAVRAESTAKHTQLLALVDDRGQYRTYHAALKKLLAQSAPPPIVPHLGAHTMEITVVEMQLPELTDLYYGGPKTAISVKRMRTLWGLVAPLVAMQTRSMAGGGESSLPPVDASREKASRIASAALRPFFLIAVEEREAADRRLLERSTALEAPPVATVPPTPSRRGVR